MKKEREKGTLKARERELPEENPNFENCGEDEQVFVYSRSSGVEIFV